MAAIEESPAEEILKNGEFRALLDPIHSGIKFAEMGSFVLGGAVGYFGTSLLLVNPLIAFGVGVGLAIGGSLGVGSYLKKNWPSGRELVADAEHIAITKHGKNEIVIDTQQHVNVLSW